MEQRESATPSAIRIVKIEGAVEQLARDMGEVRPGLSDLSKKMDGMIAIQLEQQHTSQALARAFAEIEELKHTTERSLIQVEAETKERVSKWQVWRTEITSTVDRWSGGLKMLWIISGLVWGLALSVGGYLVHQSEKNADRQRSVELYLAKDPKFTPAP